MKATDGMGIAGLLPLERKRMGTETKPVPVMVCATRVMEAPVGRVMEVILGPPLSTTEKAILTMAGQPVPSVMRMS